MVADRRELARESDAPVLERDQRSGGVRSRGEEAIDRDAEDLVGVAGTAVIGVPQADGQAWSLAHAARSLTFSFSVRSILEEAKIWRNAGGV